MTSSYPSIPGSRFSWILIVVFSCTSFVSELKYAFAQESLAHIDVLVHDGRGDPVSGLKSEDFIVRENGHDDAIVSVKPLAGSYPIPGSAGDRKSVDTFILLMIPPMEPSGYSLAIKSALAATTDLSLCSCATSILGPTGELTSFLTDQSELRTVLEHVKHQTVQANYRSTWLPKAHQAIQELSELPGHHIILAATDFDSSIERLGRNPWPIKINPSNMVGDALRARASVYTIDTSGPGTVVPFGAAADADQYSASGPALAAMLTNSTTQLGVLHGQVLATATDTGGQFENSFKKAVQQIDRDNKGYYSVTFKPQQQDLDGSWHHISVTGRSTALLILSPRYYHASLSELASDASPIPHPLIQAVQGGKELSDLVITEQLWLFPDGRRDGAYSLPFAVTIAPKSLPRSASPIQLYARLENVTFGLQVATWNVALPLNESHEARWQQEVNVGPGIYKLQIAALNAESGALGYKETPFWVHSVENQPIAASSILLSRDCQISTEPGERRRISDPIDREDGCHPKLEPEGRFREGDQIHLLLRLYPENDSLQQSFLRNWTAHILIDNNDLRDANPLTIKQAEVRGLVVTSIFTPSGVNAKPGLHNVAVVFEGPNKQRFLVETKFVIAESNIR